MADPQATALSNQLLDLFNTPGEGRSYINSLYPNEIEYYAAALELVDGDGFTEDFFSFPVMFKSYRENRVTNTNIEKTMAGVVITANPTFVPFDIHMNGNFGRKFKKNPYSANANSGSSSTPGSSTDFQHQTLPSVTVTKKIPVFSTEYKTGYGCYKIMERIILKAQKQDSNYKPYQLFFYNLALNSNYLVEPISLEPNQNRESSNMIWEYNLHLKAVAPASNVNKNYKSSLKLLTDYGSLTQEASLQSDQIDQYEQDRLTIDKVTSPVAQIIQQQAQSQAYGLNNNSQKSIIQAMLQLIAKPQATNVFSLSSGQGILNRF